MSSQVVLPPGVGPLSRVAWWIASDDAMVVAPIVTSAAAVLALSAVVILLASGGWLALAGVALQAAELVLIMGLYRAYHRLPAWPSHILVGSQVAYPGKSLEHWRSLEEPARSIARPLVDGLTIACEAYQTGGGKDAERAIAERCWRLDGLAAEQARRIREGKLAAIGPIGGDDLAVGDALLEAFRELRP